MDSAIHPLAHRDLFELAHFGPVFILPKKLMQRFILASHVPIGTLENGTDKHERLVKVMFFSVFVFWQVLKTRMAF